MQAVECRFPFHGRPQIEPPNPRKKPASKKKIHAPATPEQDGEQNEGRRALWEAFEENARPELSGFQTGQITRLSDRRSQLPVFGEKWGILHAVEDVCTIRPDEIKNRCNHFLFGMALTLRQLRHPRDLFIFPFRIKCRRDLQAPKVFCQSGHRRDRQDGQPVT